MHGPGALPMPLSTFVGRQAQTAELASLLDQTRLVSVTGLGGSGKSRLALEVARRVAANFPDGVWWVPLTHVADAAGVPDAVARAVRLSQTDGQPPAVGLPTRMRTSRALLICDDCEHVGDAVAEVIEDLLAGCADVRILTTTQRRLGVASEIAWAIPALSTPVEPQTSRDLIRYEDLSGYESVRLFVDRARNALPQFDLDDDNAAVITAVCRRLEGLPLAIELAAARIKVLSVQQIAARLDDALGLLTGGTRTAVPRHRSLRSTLDWSFELLGEPERQMLTELSAFAGTFDLDAVEAMYEHRGLGQPLDVLTELIDRSLVATVPAGQRVRYRLPEAVRQYAKSRLGEHGGGPARVRPDPVPSRAPVAVGIPLELRIQALGTACVHRGAIPIEVSAWTYAKPRELLYFLLSQVSSTKEQIGAALWPSTAPGKLRNSFHTTLHHLRRALGDPAWITYRQGRYAFNRSRPFDYDVEVLEAGLARVHSVEPAALPYLVAAAEAYRGDFLADLSGEHWIDIRRSELRSAFERVLLALGRRYAQAGQFAQAAQTYLRAITHDSLLEVAHRELIHCYARMGERARALHHYNDLVTLLRDQLGIQPSAETRTLHAALLDGTCPCCRPPCRSPSRSPSS